MKDYKEFSNDKLLDMSSNLSKNHEKIKEEIIRLHQILLIVQEDWLNITEELKKRKG